MDKDRNVPLWSPGFYDLSYFKVSMRDYKAFSNFTRQQNSLITLPLEKALLELLSTD